MHLALALIVLVGCPKANPPAELYNDACRAALAGDIDGSLQLLERSFDAGFESWEHISRDPDLVTVRADPRFPVLRDRFLERAVTHAVGLGADGWLLAAQMRQAQGRSGADEMQHAVEQGVQPFLFGPDLPWPEAQAQDLQSRRSEYLGLLGQTPITFEIPPALEIAMIALALTKGGREDDNLTDRDSAYYGEVMAWFEPYASHRLVRELDKLGVDVWTHYAFRNNAYGWAWQGGDLASRRVFWQIDGQSELWEPDEFSQRAALVAQFARDTRADEFLVAHDAYYRSLEQHYAQGVPTEHMIAWLGAQFPSVTYQGFRVVFSPLIGGNHNTSRTSFDGYGETQMFVSGPIGPMDLVDRGLYSRVLLTEIDHNYVNPISDLHRSAIDAAIPNLVVFHNGSSYESAYMTFNEYVTWAVFDAWWGDWCEEQACPADALSRVRERTTELMVHRGFVQYPAFQDAFRSAYRGEGGSIPELYPELIAWFAAKSAR